MVREEKMFLHEAIVQVLLNNENISTLTELAAEINAKKLYRRRDGKDIKPKQISARVSNHPELFFRVDGKIRFRG